jgi:hypothetical protein
MSRTDQRELPQAFAAIVTAAFRDVTSNTFGIGGLHVLGMVAAIGGFTLAALIYICFRASQSTAGAKLWSEDDRSL